MRSAFYTLVILGWLAASAGIAIAQDATAPAPDTNTAPVLDLKSFDIIWTRNIFDQSRTGPARIRPYVRPKVIDWFTFTGTMSYEKGQFAFFDSNRSEYRKVLKASDTIAGYKIASIASDEVKLAATSNQTINLPVGTQMRRVDGGRWAYAGHSAPIAETAPDSPPATDATTATPEAPASGTDNDIVKRLMLKRLQEK